jgi:hypothetical protein
MQTPINVGYKSQNIELLERKIITQPTFNYITKYADQCR